MSTIAAHEDFCEATYQSLSQVNERVTLVSAPSGLLPDTAHLPGSPRYPRTQWRLGDERLSQMSFIAGKATIRRCTRAGNLCAAVSQPLASNAFSLHAVAYLDIFALRHEQVGFVTYTVLKWQHYATHRA